MTDQKTLDRSELLANMASTFSLMHIGQKLTDRQEKLKVMHESAFELLEQAVSIAIFEYIKTNDINELEQGREMIMAYLQGVLNVGSIEQTVKTGICQKHGYPHEIEVTTKSGKFEAMEKIDTDQFIEMIEEIEEHVKNED